MSKFALVVDNQIIERHYTLPENWGNVSGLYKAEGNEALLNSLGWYTIQQANVSFDAATQFISDNTYSFENNVVIETPVISQIENPAPVTSFKDAFLANVRATRDVLLSQSDWTQLSDVQKIKSANFISQWAEYRQALRDLPDTFNNVDVTIRTIVTYPTQPTIQN